MRPKLKLGKSGFWPTLLAWATALSAVCPGSAAGFTQIANAAPHVAAGKLVAIATTGEKRSFLMKDAPTFAELGHPDLNTSVWFGLLVLAQTPQAIKDQIIAAARATHAD